MVTDIKGPNHALLSGQANRHQAEQAKNQDKAAGNNARATSTDSVSLTNHAETLREFSVDCNS